jgi:hypothetical protein
MFYHLVHREQECWATLKQNTIFLASKTGLVFPLVQFGKFQVHAGTLAYNKIRQSHFMTRLTAEDKTVFQAAGFFRQPLENQVSRY